MFFMSERLKMVVTCKKPEPGGQQQTNWKAIQTRWVQSVCNIIAKCKPTKGKNEEREREKNLGLLLW